MYQTIHKLTLNPYVAEYSIPSDAEIIKVEWQKNDNICSEIDNICLWYRFTSDDQGRCRWPIAIRTFVAFPTGCAFNDAEDLTYLGTAVNDDLVFHIFEKK